MFYEHDTGGRQSYQLSRDSAYHGGMRAGCWQRLRKATTQLQNCKPYPVLIIYL
jgi:hypothetical protein